MTLPPLSAIGLTPLIQDPTLAQTPRSQTTPDVAFINGYSNDPAFYAAFIRLMAGNQQANPNFSPDHPEYIDITPSKNLRLGPDDVYIQPLPFDQLERAKEKIGIVRYSGPSRTVWTPLGAMASKPPTGVDLQHVTITGKFDTERARDFARVPALTAYDPETLEAEFAGGENEKEAFQKLQGLLAEEDKKTVYVITDEDVPVFFEGEIVDSMLFMKRLKVDPENAKPYAKPKFFNFGPLGNPKQLQRSFSLFSTQFMEDESAVDIFSHIYHFAADIRLRDSDGKWALTPLPEMDFALSTVRRAFLHIFSINTSKSRVPRAIEEWAKDANPKQPHPLRLHWEEMTDTQKRLYYFDDLPNTIKNVDNNSYAINSGIIPADGYVRFQDFAAIIDIAPGLNENHQPTYSNPETKANKGELLTHPRYLLLPMGNEAQQQEKLKAQPTLLEGLFKPIFGLGRLGRQFVRRGLFSINAPKITTDHENLFSGLKSVGWIMGTTDIEKLRVEKDRYYRAMNIPHNLDPHSDFSPFAIIHSTKPEISNLRNQGNVKSFDFRTDPKVTLNLPAMNGSVTDLEVLGDFFYSTEIPETNGLPSLVIRNLLVSAGPMILEEFKPNLQIKMPEGFKFSAKRIMVGKGDGRFVDYIALGEPLPPSLMNQKATDKMEYRVEQPFIGIPVLEFRMKIGETVVQGKLQDFGFSPEDSVMKTAVLQGQFESDHRLFDQSFFTAFMAAFVQSELPRELLQALRAEIPYFLQNGLVRATFADQDARTRGVSNNNPRPSASFSFNNAFKDDDLYPLKKYFPRNSKTPMLFVETASVKGQFNRDVFNYEGDNVWNQFFPHFDYDRVSGNLIAFMSHETPIIRSNTPSKYRNILLNGATLFFSNNLVDEYEKDPDEDRKEIALKMANFLAQWGYKTEKDAAVDEFNKNILKAYFDRTPSFQFQSRAEQELFLNQVLNFFKQARSN